jgi:1-acyl-sn-glycerol-3-phosphate acyltransferase
VSARHRKLRPAVRRSAPPPEAVADASLAERDFAGDLVGLEREEPNPIFELEESVDRMIEAADSIDADPHARRRAAEALTELAARLGGYDPREAPEDDDSILDNARALFSPDTYLRKWGRFGLRNRSEEVDEFGLDRTYENRFAPLFDALYEKWFRVRVSGVGHVPSHGRAMIVANHGGALPLDGLMVRTALRLEHPSGRDARWLAEDFSFHMPFLGAFVTRVGAVRACPENAERLLDRDELLTVFPEGIKGVGKLYRDRYRLQRFGRGGYVKLALRTGTPIVPTGIVGAEEAYPLLLEGHRTAGFLGLPFLPVTPLFPWLGPLGLMPLPSRWVIAFGEPIDLSMHPPEAADDPLLVNQLNEQVRAQVEDLVAGALGSRESAWS